MKTLRVDKNTDPNDDSDERKEMYVQQWKLFSELIDKWVRVKMPKSEICPMSSGSHFQVCIMLNDSTELRHPLEFDRKKNLAADDDTNRKTIAEWLREVFKTGSTWEIKNFEIVPDEYFEVIEEETNQ